MNPISDLPIIWHIPHASDAIPEQDREDILLGDEELHDELARVTDWHTDSLFGDPGLPGLVVAASVSRLVVDVERFDDDAREPLSRRGLGAVYIRTWGGRPLRSEPSPEERQRLLDEWYRPHHRRLEEACGGFLKKHGRCLIIDGHSFPASGGYLEPDPGRPVPDICIGTDDFHTPEGLVESVAEAFRRQGLVVDINHPYSGSIVPMAFFQRDRRVQSLMVEVNRGLMGMPFSADSGIDSRVSAGLRRFVARLLALGPSVWTEPLPDRP